MYHRINVKYKTVKFLEDNTEENLDNLGCGSHFLNARSRTWFVKEIISWTSSKFKTCAVKTNKQTVSRDYQDKTHTGRKHL